MKPEDLLFSSNPTFKQKKRSIEEFGVSDYNEAYEQLYKLFDGNKKVQNGLKNLLLSGDIKEALIATEDHPLDCLQYEEQLVLAGWLLGKGC